ncbi:hypothetical protein ABZX30_32060, partial [Streptomyces sp. NPDC004542]|uniref:hypothetical protein n=1 Tax=Streptomyces sp. NPDC004542 TaxID=3154281 RepID=UPI0033BA8DD7
MTGTSCPPDSMDDRHLPQPAVPVARSQALKALEQRDQPARHGTDPPLRERRALRTPVGGFHEVRVQSPAVLPRPLGHPNSSQENRSGSGRASPARGPTTRPSPRPSVMLVSTPGTWNWPSGTRP